MLAAERAALNAAKLNTPVSEPAQYYDWLKPLGGAKPMATASQNISFMRPVAGGAGKHVEIVARVLKLGKSLVFGAVEMRAAGDARLAVHATTTYALMS